MLTIGGLPCYPKIGEPYGGDGLLLHSRDFGADVAFTFQDVWPIDANCLFTTAAERKWIPYLPVDWFPVPDIMYNRLKHAYRIVTISKAGQNALLERGLQSTYLPEAVDTNKFKPMDKNAIRKEMGIPENAFVFGMIAANKDDPPRKCFQHVMDAFVMFMNNHKDLDCRLFVQTLLEQQGGFNIKIYAEHLGILDRLYYPQFYEYWYKCNQDYIAKILNAFDVLLSPSNSEGFGLPIVEAQSCGIPVIVNNWASMPELVIPDKTGFICDTGYKFWTPIHAYKAFPSLQSLYDSMEKVYNADRKKMGKVARKWILENYDMENRIKNAWIPFLEQIQEEILPVSKPEIVVVNKDKIEKGG